MHNSYKTCIYSHRGTVHGADATLMNILQTEALILRFIFQFMRANPRDSKFVELARHVHACANEVHPLVNELKEETFFKALRQALISQKVVGMSGAEFENFLEEYRRDTKVVWTFPEKKPEMKKRKRQTSSSTKGLRSSARKSKGKENDPRHSKSTSSHNPQSHVGKSTAEETEAEKKKRAAEIKAKIHTRRMLGQMVPHVYNES